MKRKVSKKIVLPCKECGGRCCRYAPIDMKQWAIIKAKFPIGDDAIIEECFKGTKGHAVTVCKTNGEKGECYFLKDGRCSIYTYRPDTCRATGADGVCPMTDPEEFGRRVMAIISNGHTFLAEKDQGNLFLRS